MGTVEYLAQKIGSLRFASITVPLPEVLRIEPCGPGLVVTFLLDGCPLLLQEASEHYKYHASPGMCTPELAVIQNSEAPPWT